MPVCVYLSVSVCMCVCTDTERETEREINHMFVNLGVVPESPLDFLVKKTINFLPFCLLV